MGYVLQQVLIGLINLGVYAKKEVFELQYD